MRHNSDLFELIKSLNKNEKRYFRLYASMQSGNKNYLKLFSAVEKLHLYDEKKLREIYKKENFINQLAYTKNYLYELIIKSLASYNSERSVDSRIHLMISECKVLFSKALFRQYFRAISKAKKYALKHERFGYYLQILDMEKVIIKKEEIQTEKSDLIYKEAVTALEKIKNIFDYSRLASKVNIIYREYGTTRGQKQENELSGILTDPLLININNAQCERSKESFYRIYEIINNARADYTETLKSVEMRKKVVDNSPGPFKDYIIDLNSDIIFSMLNTYMNLNMFGEAEKYMKLYYNTLTQQPADRIEFEIYSIFFKFRLHIRKGDIKKAAKLIPVLETILETYRNKLLIDLELNILFTIIKCRILENNFDMALRSANRLMTHPLLDKRADYETYTRILNLIIHYELGNYSLLKYLIISTYRYLYKREKKFRLESVLLDFIRKIPDVKNEEILKFSFISLKRKLEELKKDEYEKNAFEYFDFVEWINGKITSK